MGYGSACTHHSSDTLVTMRTSVVTSEEVRMPTVLPCIARPLLSFPSARPRPRFQFGLHGANGVFE